MSSSPTWFLNGTLILGFPDTTPSLFHLLYYTHELHSLQPCTRIDEQHTECTGTCTVLLDGKPTSSCQLRGDDVFDKTVVTYEGLPPEEQEKHQHLFPHTPSACAACLPSLLLRLSSSHNPNLSLNRRVAQKLLTQTPCHCGHSALWSRLLQQSRLPASTLFTCYVWQADELIKSPVKRPPSTPWLKHRFLSPPLPSPQGKPFLHGTPLLLPTAHETLTLLQTQQTSGVPGAISVLTAQEFRSFSPVDTSPPPLLLLNEGERSLGASHCIAWIAAKTPEALQRAKEKTLIISQPHEPFIHTEYLRWREEHQVQPTEIYQQGDIESALQNAAHITSGSWVFPFESLPRSPVQCQVIPQGECWEIHSNSPVQERQAYLEACFPWLKGKLLCEPPPEGQTFSLHAPGVLEAGTLALALQHQQAVSTRLSKEEEIRILSKRPLFRIHQTLAAKDDGTLLGLKSHIFVDLGTTTTLPDNVLAHLKNHVTGPYRIPHVHVTFEFANSHHPPIQWDPTIGPRQIAFALESGLDLLSPRTPLDRWSLRYQNARREGDYLPNQRKLGPKETLLPLLEATRRLFYREHKQLGLACGMYLHDAFTEEPTPIDYATHLLGLSPEGHQIKRLVLANTGTFEDPHVPFHTYAAIENQALFELQQACTGQAPMHNGLFDPKATSPPFPFQKIASIQVYLIPSAESSYSGSAGRFAIAPALAAAQVCRGSHTPYQLPLSTSSLSSSEERS